jgi:flavin-binding protein dodecin
MMPDIARVTEIKSSSQLSFEDAINRGIGRAAETIELIKSAWVGEQEVMVNDGKIVEYRVLLKVTFLVKDK